jgi:hypothetical protein
MRRIVLAALFSFCPLALAFGQQSSAGDVTQRMIQRRAIEAVIWAMPAVNYELMLQEMLRSGGKVGQVIYWGRPLDAKNQTLTPTPRTRD